MTVAMPVIGRELNMNGVLLSWVPAAYNLSAAMFLLPLGRLADIKGREKLFKIGLAFFTLFSLGCALAWDATSLIAFRYLQGLGGGMIFGTSSAILAAYFPREERGKAFGIYTSGIYLGNSLGPALGGFITQSLGWRSIFGISAALALAATLFAFSRLQDRPVDTLGKVDIPGCTAYSLSLVLIMLGLSRLPSPMAGMLLVVGVAGLFAFGFIELRSPSPVLDLRAFRGNPGFIFSNLAALIGITATFAVSFLVSLYLQYIKGMFPGQAGLTMVLLSLTTAVVSSYAGKLSDKVDASKIATVGMGLSAVGLGALIFLNAATPVWVIVAYLAFLGLAFGLFSSPNTKAVMNSADKKDFGVASAALSTMRTLGMNLSMGIIMMLFSITMGRTRITPEYYGVYLKCMRLGFSIFAALCVGGIFASLPIGKKRSSGARSVAADLGFGLLIDSSQCDGCLACEAACRMEHNGRPGIRVTDRVPAPPEYCDMCVERTKRGELPVCVEQCPVHCIRHGLLPELAIEAARRPGTVVFTPH
jgi:MFS family permease